MQTSQPSSPALSVAGANIRLTWTVEEAAARLGISRPTAYEAVKSGDLPHIKIGRRILVPVVQLEKLLGQGTAGATK